MRRRSHQPVSACEVEAGRAIMLHAVSVRAAAEDAETLPAKQVVFIQTVIEVPDPVRLPQRVAARNQVAESILLHQTPADALVRSPAFGSRPVLDLWVSGKSNFVPLVPKSNRKPQPCIVRRYDDESH